MLIVPITLASAGILGLIYMSLTIGVMRQRFKTRVELGDGGGTAETRGLQIAIRAHANFAEYVPLALILLGGIEAAGAPRLLVLGLNGALILGRLLHPLGMERKVPNAPRAGGAMLTWGVILVGSITALVLAV
jgi:uncharacterized membrane protein YecN with MAPEG domain